MSGNIVKSGSEAPAQAAGYLYQLRYSLLRALNRSKRNSISTIGIELLDDVITQKDGKISSLEQLKHTVHAQQAFTDSSVAVWRTFGNWIRTVEKVGLDLSSLDLVMITNAFVAKDTGISILDLSDDRDIDSAVKLIREAALKSENQATQSDRELFLSLEGIRQHAFLRAIRIVSGNSNLADLSDEIEGALYYACQASKLADFRTELEGWWFDKCAFSLAKGEGVQVQLLELDARIDYLREKYKIENLQIDVADVDQTSDDLLDYIFMKQVNILKVNEQRLRNAQKDFLKASAQRSKWLREAKIDPADLSRYDNILEESWLTQSAIVSDELPADATEDTKCKTGRSLLGWAETQQTPLRGAAAQFLTSGSYHALADQVRLGWHPDYKKLFGGK